MVRNIFQLPSRTHRYLIEPVSCSPHLFPRLTNRFIKFYNNLYNSDKCVINNLRCVQERDLRSTFGCNISKLSKTNNIFAIDMLPAKYYEIEANDKWRSNLIIEILKTQNNILSIDFNTDYMNSVLTYVACS